MSPKIFCKYTPPVNHFILASIRCQMIWGGKQKKSMALGIKKDIRELNQLPKLTTSSGKRSTPPLFTFSTCKSITKSFLSSNLFLQSEGTQMYHLLQPSAHRPPLMAWRGFADIKRLAGFTPFLLYRGICTRSRPD